MQSHLNTLYRLQVLGVKYCTRYCHGIYGIAGRESERELSQRIIGVIIYDGISKVDGVSNILLYGILKLNYHLLTAGSHLGSLGLRRRYDDLL